jgi:KDO2-lipid IV(A) lauroyltransferase
MFSVILETALCLVARAVIGCVQALPLEWVARLGLAGGGLVYRLDGRHRRVALRNLTKCFGGEKPAAAIEALARENFRRIGESFACAAKTAAMSFEQLRSRVEFVGDGRLLSPPASQTPPGVVAAIGHFGNFELYARFGQFAPGYKCATTYRALRQASLNRLLQSLRGRSGCLYFERRTEGAALKTFMRQPGVMLGLLSDQSSGEVRLPFLGHDCATSLAPAIFALRYHCVLITGVCYRVGLARWRIEAGREIPTHENGQPRSAEAIMRDVNQAFEEAVRRDPANWFWVHNRWKPAPNNGRGAKTGGRKTSDTPAEPTEVLKARNDA